MGIHLGSVTALSYTQLEDEIERLRDEVLTKSIREVGDIRVDIDYIDRDEGGYWEACLVLVPREEVK